MPYKKKPYSKKRKTYKKRGSRNTTARVGGSMVPHTYPKNIVDFGNAFPKKVLIKQRYCETISLLSTTGTLVNYLYSLNGMYDPNASAGGHQPMYFDQMIALYNHYTVIGSKITVRFISLESNTVPMTVCLWQNDDTTVSTAYITADIEQTGASFTLLGSDGSTANTLSLKYSPKKVFGGSVLGNSNLRGDVSNNPAEGTYGVISVIAADQASSGTVICQVCIEYIAIYDELRELPSS